MFDYEGQHPIEFLHPNMIRKGNQVSKPASIGPKESDSVEEWHQFFQTQVNEKGLRTATSFDSLYLQGRTKLDSYCETWNSTTRWMYRLHVWLFLVNHIEEKYRRGDLYFYDSFSFYRRRSQEWFSELVEIVSHLDREKLRDEYEPFVLSTKDYLVQNAFHDEETITDWSLVYGFLWNRLLLVGEWMREEMQRLRAELPKPQLSAFGRDGVIKALLYFEIQFGRDQQAMELASTLHAPDLTWCFPHLQMFLNDEEWSRMVAWLTWLKPRIQSATRDVLMSYLQYWEIVGQNNPAYDNDWEQTLVDLLPDSAVNYARYLMERGKFQQWVDLHLFTETSPMELHAGDLKQVEAQDRRLLLPLYHQAAEKHILEKNRDSYKRAVKLLKKLKTHYKKLKEERRWERYIEILSVTYKRYRAFQEELEKGKLLP
ncbi:hypothetical protein [Tumebacillus flagellatus]|uniref:hypothetical protein n=1 Tax=Tumebacillus flagellatus TaxID=1157490 RepID=UPI001EE66B89|nr:hypothetical protein [Tumebacillus flagellatus]